MIYTSYFANKKNLPNNIVPVAICMGSPQFWTGLHYGKLAPKYSFFSVWKQNGDNEYYINHFKEEVLDRLNPNEVYQELQSLVGEDKVICLVCYEGPDKFCHRHLVAEWFRQNGFPCEEYYNKR